MLDENIRLYTTELQGYDSELIDIGRKENELINKTETHEILVKTRLKNINK